MSKYRWENPSDWLESRSDIPCDPAILSVLDGDTIQDLFQKEMEQDGYFEEEGEEEEDA